MPKSINQIQAELLSTSFFNKLTANKTDYEQLDGLPSVKEMILLTVGEFIISVQENLDKKGKVSTGGLIDGISAGELEETNNSYKITIGYDPGSEAAKYYDYVNKGVSGLVTNKSISKYKFRYLGVSNKFRDAIKDWIKKNSISAKVEDQTKGQSKLQKKRKAIKKIADQNKKLKSVAYAMALGIKKRGLPYTGYFDKPIEKYFGKEFIKVMTNVYGQDIKAYMVTFDNKIKKL